MLYVRSATGTALRVALRTGVACGLLGAFTIAFTVVGIGPAAAQRPLAFRSPVSYALAANVGEIMSADMDGDGYRDIVAINGSFASVLFNRGDGTFNAPV